MYALVQVCKLAETGCKSIVLVNLGLLKNLGIRMEGNYGSGLIGFSDHFHRSDRLALGVLLHEDLSFPVHLCNEQVRKRIHAGHTHTVETSGNLVTVLAELTSGVEHGKHHLKGGAVLLLVHSGRDTASVILYPYGIVGKNPHVDGIAEACHSLVYTVVHNLIDKMVESPLVHISDVH